MIFPESDAFEKGMDLVSAALGEYAPKKHEIYVDYKENGVDKHTVLKAWIPCLFSPDTIIDTVFRELPKSFKITGITEPVEGGALVYYLDMDEVRKDVKKHREGKL